MFGFRQEAEVPQTRTKTESTVTEADVKWQQHSAGRWMRYFEMFMCDLDIEDHHIDKMEEFIRKASLAADAALAEEQARWGRTGLAGW